MIPVDKFETVVENTPLVSVDFIISDKDGKYLLGKRRNKPAQGFWFVLGGRIYKNEQLDDAIQRISLQEFNHKLTLDKLEFDGIYEHFYSDSFVGEGISTHYVVLAYRFACEDALDLPTEQHSEYRYFSKEEILGHSDVHTYTKNYFKGNK